MRSIGMKHLWAGLQLFSATVSAQIYIPNIVGYVNAPQVAGDSLIGNPLSTGTNNLNIVFPMTPVIPDGTTISIWDAGTRQFRPPSTYHFGVGWDIDYSLPPGDGALLHATSAFTNTFVGAVLFQPGTDLVPLTPPSRDAGLYLLSSLWPANGRTFQDIVGRNAVEGEYVKTLNVTSQTYVTTTFHNAAWDNGVPSLNAGQAAFFNIIPEPNSTALVCLGLAALVIYYRFSHR